MRAVPATKAPAEWAWTDFVANALYFSQSVNPDSSTRYGTVTLVGAGPGGATTSMSIYIYEAFLCQGDIGRAMAAAILLFGASFLLLSIARRRVGQRLLFPLVVSLRALLLIIFAIPLYLLYTAVGLLDTRLGLG